MKSLILEVKKIVISSSTQIRRLLLPQFLFEILKLANVAENF